MNAFDVIGWMVNGTYFCNSCKPTNEELPDAHPIFADSEADSFSHCETCEELIPEVLTEKGYDDVIKKFREFLVRRDGRLEILAQWAEEVLGTCTGEKDKAICELVKEACLEDNSKHAMVIEVRRLVKLWEGE